MSGQALFTVLMTLLMGGITVTVGGYIIHVQVGQTHDRIDALVSTVAQLDRDIDNHDATLAALVTPDMVDDDVLHQPRVYNEHGERVF